MKKTSPLKQDDIFSLSQKFSVGKIYKECFLEYASYVICDRAIPSSLDGLKPVQRRILYSMSEKEDGRYHKVANIIGHTMQYHPHGDAAISDALVKLGQKACIIDCQGNWGNLLTGDSAAAPRYIEARLTSFAKEVLFAKDVTHWQKSYDNRNNEPQFLPVKFPLLLLMGTEGIAVGLSTKILPHNFSELVQESIAILEGFKPQILPDFFSGGSADFSEYQDGKRGGKVKIRATLEIVNSKLIKITELPFAVTTSSLIESVLKASEKGKIRIKKIEDNTADVVEILVHIFEEDGIDNMINALFLFTDCEVQYSTNCCVIENGAPLFLSISDYLRKTVENTKNILAKELKIKIDKRKSELFFLKLETVFIKDKIYQIFETCDSWESALQKIKKAFLDKKICKEHEIDESIIEKLSEIKIKRLSKFDQKISKEKQKKIASELKQLNFDLKNIIAYTINYYKEIKAKFTEIASPRKTKVEIFSPKKALDHVYLKKKIFIHKDFSYAGFSLKNAELLCEGNEKSSLLVVSEEGFFRLVKVSDKSYLGKNIKFVSLFDNYDDGCLYDILVLDKETDKLYAKRIKINNISKGRDNALIKSSKKMKVFYFSKVKLGPSKSVKIQVLDQLKLSSTLEVNFKNLQVEIYNVHSHCIFDACLDCKIIEEKSILSFSEQRWWYDKKNNCLNDQQKGMYLGKLSAKDHILQIYNTGKVVIENFYPELIFYDDIKYVSKVKKGDLFFVVYLMKAEKQFFLKRFVFDSQPISENLFISENEFKIHNLLFEKDAIMEISYIDDKSKKIRKQECDLRSFFKVDTDYEKELRLPFKNILSLEKIIK